MKNKKSIFSNRCWLDGKLQPATLCFDNAVITEIHLHKVDGAEDVGENILMPGIIDAHVHINEPGRTEWEGFETATQAAAAGGITTIVDMPLNANPVTTTVVAFDEKIAASKDKLHVNVGFYGGLIPGNQDSIESLIQAGVLGIKCFLTHSGIDEFPNVGEKEMDAAMPVISKICDCHYWRIVNWKERKSKINFQIFQTAIGIIWPVVPGNGKMMQLT